MSQERKSVLKLACFMLSCRPGLILALIKAAWGLQHLYSVMLGLTCAVIAYAKSTARCDTDTAADKHATIYPEQDKAREYEGCKALCSVAVGLCVSPMRKVWMRGLQINRDRGCGVWQIQWRLTCSLCNLLHCAARGKIILRWLAAKRFPALRTLPEGWGNSTQNLTFFPSFPVKVRIMLRNYPLCLSIKTILKRPRLSCNIIGFVTPDLWSDSPLISTGCIARVGLAGVLRHF